MQQLLLASPLSLAIAFLKGMLQVSSFAENPCEFWHILTYILNYRGPKGPAKPISAALDPLSAAQPQEPQPAEVGNVSAVAAHAPPAAQPKGEQPELPVSTISRQGSGQAGPLEEGIGLILPQNPRTRLQETLPLEAKPGTLRGVTQAGIQPKGQSCSGM